MKKLTKFSILLKKNIDDDELKTSNRNKSSTTNKNEAGFYFTNTNKYNFPSTPSNINEPHHDNELARHSSMNTTTHEIKRISSNSGLHSNNNEVNRSSVLSYQAPSSYATCETVNTNNSSWRKHAIEAGINLNMPGQSEQQYRYTKPVKPNYKNFVVNPQQDSRLLKRPFLLADYDSITTEYRQRFMFPDKNKIDKFPWIKG